MSFDEEQPSGMEQMAATAIKIEKRLCAALGKKWSPTGISVVTLSEAAADEIEQLRAALVQVREVCDDNAAASCNQSMALAFVRSVAADALT